MNLLTLLQNYSLMDLGGIVGSIKGGSVKNCSSNVKFIIDASYDDFVEGKLKNLNVGGIAGSAQNTTFKGNHSISKIFIRDKVKFEDLITDLSKSLKNADVLDQAKSELEDIYQNIGKPAISEKIERFLNIVNGVMNVVEPYKEYLFSLIP